MCQIRPQLDTCVLTACTECLHLNVALRAKTVCQAICMQCLQVQERNGAVQPLAAGDSVLMQVGRAWCEVAAEAVAEPDKRQPAWDMAAVTLLLPDELVDCDDGELGGCFHPNYPV